MGTRDNDATTRGRRDEGWSSQVHEVVDQLFVYGTLRAGQPARSMIANHVAGAIPATVPGRLFALPGGYPGMLEGSGDGAGTGREHRVIGEVVTLTELAAAFALLDAYEGDEFLRTLLCATLEGGDAVWAWCYVVSDSATVRGCEPIESGDWSAYTRAD